MRYAWLIPPCCVVHPCIHTACVGVGLSLLGALSNLSAQHIRVDEKVSAAALPHAAVLLWRFNSAFTRHTGSLTQPASRLPCAALHRTAHKQRLLQQQGRPALRAAQVKARAHEHLARLGEQPMTSTAQRKCESFI
jgi:hypothetical protein